MPKNSSSFSRSGIESPANFSRLAFQSGSICNSFFDLFPHRFDYIYAPHPDPQQSPAWLSESRHPLSDRLLQQANYLYGVRFGAKTQYCLLDIDAGSVYHPIADPLAISRILAQLETIGLVNYVACSSSYSGGLHLYFPFQQSQNSWEIGTAVVALLETSGFAVKPGQIEVFPNRQRYSVQGKPSLFNAHRLPLQNGSYLLNQDFQPVWSDQASFVIQWRLTQSQNQLSVQAIRRILKQSQRRHYQVSGKAAKFINDLNAEIELGWTGAGQTNYLLGRITMRAYIFHHVLEGGSPLTGRALVDQIVATASSLPGYQNWCQHQHEIEQRASDWADCIEKSHYFHYGDLKKPEIQLEEISIGLTWNQQQCESVRNRIGSALADLLNQGRLPSATTARFKALVAYGISGSSLYRHKDLWHPEFLDAPEPFEQPERINETLDQAANSTSLFPSLDCNPAPDLAHSGDRAVKLRQTGCNPLTDFSFAPCSVSESRNPQQHDLYDPRIFKPP